MSKKDRHPRESKEKIDHNILELMKVFNDEYVQAELDDPPLSIDQKIEGLSSLLKTVQQATKWNNEPRYSQATVQAVRAEYEYWKDQENEVNQVQTPDFDTLAESMSLKGSSGWSKETYKEFFQTWYENQNLSPEKIREKAIELNNHKNIKNELKEVPTSTLYTWKDKAKSQIV